MEASINTEMQMEEQGQRLRDKWGLVEESGAQEVGGGHRQEVGKEPREACASRRKRC